VLLHHAKSDRAIIDFVSVAADRDAQHFLIRLDYVQFFFDVETRRSVVDFFACDFSPDSDSALTRSSEKNIFSVSSLSGGDVFRWGPRRRLTSSR
jgi:hypothetical protein